MLECLLEFLKDYECLDMLKFLKDYEYLATWILLPIEIVFLYFVLKEFEMTRKSFEMTRKSFEWQEEEHNKKVEADIERKLKVICGFVYQRFYGKVELEQQNNNIQPNISDLLTFAREEEKDFDIPEVLVIKRFNFAVSIQNGQSNIKTIYDDTLKDKIGRLENIMDFTDCFSPNKKEAYKKIQKCYEKIHNYWKAQVTGDINDEIMIAMIWGK